LGTPVHKWYDPDESFKDKFDAYWIDRKGNCYGANGDTACMLHIKLAEAICRDVYGYIGEDLEGINPPLLLEENGYVKMTGDWVLFCAENSHVVGKELVYFFKYDKPLTGEQKKVVYNIIRYGYCQQYFYAADCRRKISLNDFRNMDDMAINYLFKM
jgi:hypothetical protein